MIVFNYFMETAARPQELLGRWSTILIKTILVLIKYIILIYFIRKGHCLAKVKRFLEKKINPNLGSLGLNLLSSWCLGLN